MPSSTHKETIEVPGSPPLKGIDGPKPPEGASLVNRLTIAASLLSMLSSIMRLLETMTPELYLQLVIEFWRMALIIVIAVINILW